MSAQELDTTGSQRIQIYPGEANDPVTILLNGNALGNLQLQEHTSSKDFQLAGGSILYVQAVSGQAQVLQNGRIVFSFSPRSELACKDARPQRVSCLTTWLILNLFAAFIYTLLFFIAGLGDLTYTGMYPSIGDTFLLMGLMGILAIAFGVAALLVSLNSEKNVGRR